MRACGEVRLALYNACRALATPERGATLREMALHAKVGFDAARCTVRNMSRAGQLDAVGERVVDYRNRPVVEYVAVEPGRHTAAPGNDCLWRVWG